jgi:hypothetical protein
MPVQVADPLQAPEAQDPVHRRRREAREQPSQPDPLAGPAIPANRGSRPYAWIKWIARSGLCSGPRLASSTCTATGTSTSAPPPPSLAQQQSGTDRHQHQEGRGGVALDLGGGVAATIQDVSTTASQLSDARATLAKVAGRVYADPTQAIERLTADSRAPAHLIAGQAAAYGQLNGRAPTRFRQPNLAHQAVTESVPALRNALDDYHDAARAAARAQGIASTISESLPSCASSWSARCQLHLCTCVIVAEHWSNSAALSS